MIGNQNNRLAYEGKIEAQLVEWGSTIDRWQNQTHTNIQTTINHLNHKRQVVRKQLGAMQAANDDRWREFRTDLDKAVEDMRHAIDQAREQIRHGETS